VSPGEALVTCGVSPESTGVRSCAGERVPVVGAAGGVVSECESSVGGAVRPRLSGNQSIAQNGWVWVGHAVRTAWR
jgi:hypothetical protein